MDENTKNMVACNLVIAFYSAVEPLPAFLGQNRRKSDAGPSGLDMRNPSISPDEIFDVYKRFLAMIEKADK
jgi:hypothetical protein